MATKTRTKGARAAGRGGTSGGRRRTTKRGTALRRRGKAGATAKKTRVAARGRKPRTPKHAAGGATSELAALRREKRQLEKRLTDMVREIGQLRYHEARAAQLERQLAERDQTIGQLRSELAEFRNRQPEPRRDADVQPSLALGSRSTPEFEDFDDDLNADDEDEGLL